jgi:hypothetical protein
MTSRLGRLLKNLPRLREIGFGANRRVLEIEKVNHDAEVGAKVFEKMQRPLEVEGQHSSALRFGDPRVHALLSVLLLFAFPRAFAIGNCGHYSRSALGLLRTGSPKER